MKKKNIDNNINIKYKHGKEKFKNDEFDERFLTQYTNLSVIIF